MRIHHALPALILTLAFSLPLAPHRCRADGTPPPATQPSPTTQPFPAAHPAATAAARPPSQPAPKTDTLANCRAAYMAGNYSVAAVGFEKLLPADSMRLAASLGLADALSMEGKYDKATEALSRVQALGEADAPWQLSMSDLLAAVGKYDEALDHAKKADELKPLWAPAIFARGNLLETLGRTDEAVAVYKTMESVVANEEYRNDAPSLVAMGKILDRYGVLTGRKASEQAQNILQNYLQQAYQQTDAKYWPANVAAGMFLLSKHKGEAAVQEFQLASKLNPRIPDVNVGLASVALGNWQFEQCLGQIGTALSINPNDTDALVVKATCLMQWRKLEQVEPVLQQALKVNPNQLDALSLMAALHVRLEQPDKAQPYIDRVGKINPKYFDLPNQIGQWLAAVRQFDQAEKYFQKAVALAPREADPLTNLGLMYMQTGDEAKAKETLEKAQAIDDFRADVVNYLNLLQRLEKFQSKETAHFIVRVSGEQDAVLLDQVADYMEKVYGEVCGDFNYQPADKSIVEFFPTHQQFSIRITGRGWIGTVGASTGRVIALVAPTPQKDRSPMGTYNWQAVLRHEFTHTITLAATHNRIPHWFTEACAVWEQPDRRNFEATRLLVDAVRTKHLFPVKELDWGFIRPQRGADRSLAYAQSEWIMEYIIGTRGFTTIQKMLDSFRDGMTQPEVFLKVVGAKEEDFDQAFREWAKDQVREWGYDPEPPPRLEDARKAAASQPSDAAAQANVALALLVQNQVKPAEDAARAALKLDGNNARALGVLAQILVGTKRWDEAISLGVKLEGVDPSSRVAPRVLAECYLNKQSWAQAIAVLELLKQRAPLDPFSFEQLATLYTQLGQTEKALPNLIELHRRTMNDPQYARRIADIYRSSDQNDQALSYYEQIASINPYESSAYQSMAAIHAGQRKYDLAIEDVKKVCILQPESAEAWSMLAMVQFRAGKAANDRARLEEAKQSAEKALKIDPDCQAKDILEMIDEMLKQ